VGPRASLDAMCFLSQEMKPDCLAHSPDSVLFSSYPSSLFNNYMEQSP